MSILVWFIWVSPPTRDYKLRPEEGPKKGRKHNAYADCVSVWLRSRTKWLHYLYQIVFLFHLESWVSKPLRKLHYIMEVSKGRSVLSPVVFSSIFLSVICFAGLVHVEMELHVQRQMLQVLNQQREGELELRNTPHEDKESLVKMSHSDTEKGT